LGLLKHRVDPEVETAVVALALELPAYGQMCYGRTPMRTFLDSLELAKEKLIPALSRASRCNSPTIGQIESQLTHLSAIA
jgi:hypothetical protein